MRSSEPVSADRILKDVLRIVSPNVLSAERVLDRIVGQDRRFVRVAGRWRAEPERKDGLERGAVLHFEAARGTAGRLGRGAIYIPETAQFFEFHLGDARSAATAHAVAADRPLLAWNSARVYDWNRMLRACGVAPWVQGSISLERLAVRALGDAASGNLDGLAARLGLRGADPDRPQSMARLLYDCAVEILQAVPPEHRDLEALIRWIDSGREKVDFGRFAFGPELLDELPLSPGVYLMRNRAGDALTSARHACCAAACDRTSSHARSPTRR
jgi:hypothetical protein